MTAEKNVQRILVISDTHHHAVKVSRIMKSEKSFDLCLVLGDVVGQLKEIQDTVGCTVIAVKGNCDHESGTNYTEIYELGSHRIFMTHGHRYDVSYDLETLKSVARECECDIALYGHTHRPYYKKFSDGLILANPGSLGNPRQFPAQPSYMVIEYEPDSEKIRFYQRFLEW